MRGISFCPLICPKVVYHGDTDPGWSASSPGPEFREQLDRLTDLLTFAAISGRQAARQICYVT